MRIAVLILGLLLGLLMFFQTFLVYVLSSAFDAEAQAGAAALGLMVAILWLVACAFVIGFPLFSTIVFVVAGLLGFAASSEFPDMGVWGGIALFLAAMSFFGWRGKRKTMRAKQAEDMRQRERDDRLEALLSERNQAIRPGFGSIEVTGRQMPAGALAAMPD